MTINSEKTLTVAGAMFLAFLAGTDGASAIGSQNVEFNHPAFANVGLSAVSVPIGHAEFCKSHSNECTVNAAFEQAARLTDDGWQELLSVNQEFNASIIPISDSDLYQVNEFWTYPTGYGDCEDYVLAKRRALIDRGWSPSTLLIAVVREQNGEGHAVLMVRTDRGDLVLDNQEALIKVWNDTPYQYIKRQSQHNAGEWVDVHDDRSTTIASR